MKTYRDTLDLGKKELREGGVENSELDAWLLLEFVCGISRAWYFAHDRDEIEEDRRKTYEALIKKRKEHIPLQQLTQEAYFFGHKFYVDGSVLVPRQDTEILVEEVLKECEGRQGIEILDMCTGSGCILISLLKNLDQAVGTGADLSYQALEVARRNGADLEVSAKWIQSDLFSCIQGTYDVIVSNPPYIPSKVIEGLMEEVRLYEPRMALDGHEDGLYFYREITRLSGDHLSPGGLLAFEIGYDQGQAVPRLMEERGFEDIRVVKDLAGLDRAVIGRKNKEEKYV